MLIMSRTSVDGLPYKTTLLAADACMITIITALTAGSLCSLRTSEKLPLISTLDLPPVLEIM